MSLRSALLAAATLMASANAHVLVSKPVPYSVDKLDNSPITGAQYPCKAQNGFTVSEMNSMKVGEEQTLQLKGSAIHGGGSCQLSVTTDTEPTANSKFKVIMSMEGNCPKGTDASYSFKLPDSIPNGKATFAWSWFSRLSGAPELYMNCAPIDVTGGASDTSAFDQLPDLLVANIGEGCTTVANMNTKFPNPGENLITDNSLAESQPPTGNCGASGNSPGGNSPGSPASSGAAGAPSSPASSAPAAGPSQPAESAPAAPSSPASPSSPATGGGQACTENGAVVCNGADQFGICNNGQVVWQAVSAGTTCSNGAIQKRTNYIRQLKGRVARPRVIQE
ncbi:hypothetical protein EJ04DRAFT_428963 [Polyplosphaeria fusca]|uniref:Lytic polysaccharide monooxygenase n=1 Tax=Polyplosphaeria fusca TaxID=682080 RepID=A0A9P4V534_9PLEO|nr:hypothetical protein EJ04DRAFT_428963 [Polyplosphaeria fusca]